MANILVAPAFWKSKTLFAKAETTYDTVATLVATDWIEGRNVSFTPYQASQVDRNIDFQGKGRMARLNSVPNVKLTFDVAIAPSGSKGVAPKWGSLLLGSGFAETVVATTSVTYNLVSGSEKSLTFAFANGQDKWLITGARGTVTFKLSANGIPLMSYEFTGHYNSPVANTGGAALPTPDKTGWTVEQMVDRRYSMGSINAGTAVPVAFKDFSVNVAQSIKAIEYPGPQSEVLIDDRAPTSELQMLAPARSVLDPDSLITNATVVSGSFIHGVGAGKVATLNIRGRVTNYNTVELDGLLGYKLDFDLEASSATNDEFSLVLT